MKKVGVVIVVLLFVVLFNTPLGLTQDQSTDDSRYATEDIVIDAPWRVQGIYGEFQIPVVVSVWATNEFDGYEWKSILIEQRNTDNTLIFEEFTSESIQNGYNTKRIIVSCSNLTHNDITCNDFFQDGSIRYITVELKIFNPDDNDEKTYSKALKVRLSTNQLPRLNTPQFSGWYYGDGHFHTIFTNQEDDLGQKETGGDFWMIQQAGINIGLDWVTTTDHTEIPGLNIGYLTAETWDTDGQVSLKDSCSTYSLTAQLPNLLIIPGEEIYANLADVGHHMVTYGQNDFVPSSINLFGSNLPTIMGNISNSSGICFAAHPFDSNLDWSEDKIEEALNYQNVFKGFELWNTFKYKKTSGNILTTLNNIDPFPWEGIELNWSDELNDGIIKWDQYLIDNLETGRRKIYISGGSDAHGDFNYEVTAPFAGINPDFYDNAFGKVRTAVYCPNGMGISKENVLNALANGRSVVTNGPLAVFGIDTNNDGIIDINIGEDFEYKLGEGSSLIVNVSTNEDFGGSFDIDLFIHVNSSIACLVGAQETFVAGSGEIYEWVINLDEIFNGSNGWHYLRLEAFSKSSNPELDKKFRCYTNPIWVNVIENNYNISGTVSGPSGGIKGTLVRLVDDIGQVLDSKYPDGIGNYIFENYPIGEYTVQFLIPACYQAITTQEVSFSMVGDFIVNFELDCKTNPISQGLCYLRNSAIPSGNNYYWPTWSGYNGSVGIASLVVLAHYIHGIDKNDPIVRGALDFIMTYYKTNGAIHYAIANRIYETSMALIALNAANIDGEFDDQVTLTTTYLVSAQNGDGGWRYYGNDSYSDISVTQWPVLALDAVGYSNLTVWNKIRNFTYARQTSRGEFKYSYNYSQGGGGITSAGLWTLLLHPEAVDNESHIINGFNWLNNNFTVTYNPGYVHGGSNYYYFYYLYSMGKACQLRGDRYLGTHDWYDEIYNRLESTQATNGSWVGNGSVEVTKNIATVFALLTLQLKELPLDGRVEFAIHSPADLHIYSPSGTHTGYNYSHGTSTIEENIANSSFGTTPEGGQIISIDPLSESGEYSYQLIPTGTGPYSFTVTVYQNDVEVDYYEYSGNIENNQYLGGSCDIHAIEGQIQEITEDPAPIPFMEIDPAELTLKGDTSDVFEGSFIITESSGVGDLTNVTVWSNDLTDSSGQIISADSITLTPTFIGTISSLGQNVVNYRIAIPNNIEPGIFSGPISVQSSNAGTKSVMLTVKIRACLDSTLFILPSPMSTIMMHSINEKAILYLYGFDEGYGASDVNLLTLKLNDSVSFDAPILIDDFEYVPLFGVNDVIQINYNLPEFVACYGWMYDTTIVDYYVTGEYSDGAELNLCGAVMITGHTSGDLNLDGEFNITDLTLLIDYLFRGNQFTAPEEAADINHDGNITITDLTEMINILFMTK